MNTRSMEGLDSTPAVSNRPELILVERSRILHVLLIVIQEHLLRGERQHHELEKKKHFNYQNGLKNNNISQSVKM